MLTNFACFVPSILLLLSRRPNRLAILLMSADVLCIVVQIVALWVLPVGNSYFLRLIKKRKKRTENTAQQKIQILISNLFILICYFFFK